MASLTAEAIRSLAKDVLLVDQDGANDKALALARDLVLTNRGTAITHRLLGELHYAAATRAAHGDGTAEERKASATPHLRIAREELIEARRLAPDCVEIACALGDAFAASRMFKEAEAEFVRAGSIPRPCDPALHNAAYGMLERHEHERDPAFASVRVEAARARARASYAHMKARGHELLSVEIQRVLACGKQLGAVEGREQARLVAENFPDLARAQHLHAYMDLEFVRSLDESIDKRPFLRHTLSITQRAAWDFPNSPVVASFHAKLLFVLGEYHAAERECRRALEMEDPDDPQQDCITPGSISGEHRGAKLASLGCEFHELINNILVVASDYWESMSKERQRDSFLRISFDALEDEYRRIDRSYAFSMSDVQSLVKEQKSWRFWVCPICDLEKFMDTGLLLSHMCSSHPRAVLPCLQSILDPKLRDDDEALHDDLDGFTFCEDQQDMICFNKNSGVFKWLFYAPSSGVGPSPIPDILEKKREKGRMLLEDIKEKMKSLPADRSSTEFAEAFPQIQEKWKDFLKFSAMDYREPVLTLARSFLWREFKKCMSEDPEEAARRISLADIDAVFTNKNPSNIAYEDHETGDSKQSSPNQKDRALKDSEDDQERMSHMKVATKSGDTNVGSVRIRHGIIVEAFSCCSTDVLTDADEEKLSNVALKLCKEEVLGGFLKMEPRPKLGSVTWGGKPGKPRPRYTNKEFKVVPSSSLRLAPRKHTRLGRLPCQRTIGVGVDAILIGGRFCVPESLKVNPEVDGLNNTLADCYTSVSTILKVKQVSVLFSTVKGEKDLISDKSVKEVVREIRNTCSRVRKEVLMLGALPLKEPVNYWRQKFSLVKF